MNHALVSILAIAAALLAMGMKGGAVAKGAFAAVGLGCKAGLFLKGAIASFGVGFVGAHPTPMDANLSLTQQPTYPPAATELPITITSNNTSLALDLGAGYEPGGIGQKAALVIDVKALGGGTSDAAVYTLQGQESKDGSNWANLGNALVLQPSARATAGVKTIPCISTSRYIRLNITISTTGPETLTYSAWFAPER